MYRRNVLLVYYTLIKGLLSRYYHMFSITMTGQSYKQVRWRRRHFTTGGGGGGGGCWRGGQFQLGSRGPPRLSPFPSTLTDNFPFTLRSSKQMKRLWPPRLLLDKYLPPHSWSALLPFSLRVMDLANNKRGKYFFHDFDLGECLKSSGINKNSVFRFGIRRVITFSLKLCKMHWAHVK